MEDYLQVGVIASTHGIRGEVKVFPTTDDVQRYKKLKRVILDTGKEQLDLEIQGVKFFKKFVIVKFKGMDDINNVEKYRGKPLFVARSQAVPLKKDEYFVADMIGMRVFTDEEQEFGILKSIMETGANDVYVIEHPVHGEVLVPAIRQCIRQIDIEAGEMTIHLMDGLI